MKIRDFADGFVAGYTLGLLIQALMIGYVQRNELDKFDYKS